MRAAIKMTPAMSDPDDKSRRELSALKLAAAVYVATFAAKLGVYFATGVLALLAEALHTLSDVIVVGFLLLALRWSRQAPDEDHMFGHERAQSVAALVAATLFVSFTSLRLFEESLPRLLGLGHPVEPPQRFGLAVAVLVGSMLVAALPLVKMLRDRPTGAAAKAQLLELVNDELGLGAALVGTVLTSRGYPIADPIATAVVATIIAKNGIGLFRENFDLVVGRAPESAFLAAVRRTAESVAGVIDVHDLRAERYGHGMVRTELHITVRRGLPIEDAHRIEQHVRRRVLAVDGCRQCHVHVDAAPESTGIAEIR